MTYKKRNNPAGSGKKTEPRKNLKSRLERKEEGNKPAFRSETKKSGKHAAVRRKTRTNPRHSSSPEESLKSRINKKKDDGMIRLNRYISNAGVCSRRDADVLITNGEIKVNGKQVTELGFKVNVTDRVHHNGKLLTLEKFKYVLLNKPKDFITTTDDPQDRRTVMQLVSKACEERIYPVGRLDRNTTGLLLLTNDGELAKKLSHPSHKVQKIYQVILDKPISNEDFLKITEGLDLDDGPVKVDDLAIISQDKKTLGLEIHLGRNRIVRRIFESLGYEIEKLDRVVFAGLTKKDLKRGSWRFLSDKELVRLKHMK